MNTLIINLRERKAEAFVQIYKEAFPMSARFILNNGGQKEDAEDIFQEALFILLTRLNDDEFILKVKISTYLYAIIIKMWRYKLRQMGKQLKTLEINEKADELPDVDDVKLVNNSDDELTLNILRTIDNSSKSDCQRILNAYYFDGLSLAEIADEEGYSLNYVKKKKAKCLKHFRTLFENQSEIYD